MNESLSRLYVSTSALGPVASRKGHAVKKSRYVKTLILSVLISATSFVQAECVILLHGLARSENSMKKLEKALSRELYAVQNVGYESRRFPLEQLAEMAIAPALDKCGKQKVNFVTHSMGGILVRQYLKKHKVEQLKRVVMLGPPNAGSEVIDRLGKFPGFHFFNGDAGLQLGTGEVSVPNTLGRVDFDLGIIAGNRSINLILSSIIPGEDDGKVSVERTKVEGMNDHLILPVTHTFMMSNARVIQQVLAYLKTGNFVPSSKK
ncbi:MAG: pimeloyl-ACP methyl ester carboxylesterase [Lentisphaeria bacterium]|jgi:pimeloyl-ACP methyl ester carboxylesterase